MTTVIPMPQYFKTTCDEAVLSLSDASYIIDESIPPEGYEIDFCKGSLEIRYSDDAGMFYAQQTIRQILSDNPSKCPCFTIKDSPKFSHRGFMIDCARHSFTLDELKTVIESAALMKFNKFHWHLTDDQGWRIEIESHPRLVEIGSARKMSNFGDVTDESEYRRYFTKAEIREIVEFCRQRHIDVIPEVDMPGHTMAILASYNELGCEGKKIEVATNQGVKKDILCVSNEALLPFIKDVLDEVCELFPYEYIHIGGDEAPPSSWEKCPSCSKKKEELGLDNYHALQGWFTKQVTDYLSEKGKRAIVWNESLLGGVLTPDDVVVQHWLDKPSLSYEFANNGGKIIESDYPHYYFDYPNGMTSLKKAYNYVPYNKRLTDTGRQNVMGVECELWTEFIRSFDDLCMRLYPRMLAVAESGWCKEKTDYKAFEARVEAFIPMLNSMGISVVPKNEWNLRPIPALTQTIKFYKAFVTLDVILEFLKSD